MDEAELKDFGERLEWALKLRAMNKSHLAALIGVTPSAISQWISGDSKGYDAVNAIKAADALGLNVKWLVLGKGPRFAISQDAETVAGAIEALPKEARQESFDFVLYKIERNEADLVAGEKMADYHRMLSSIIADMKKRDC
ncbi:MAG TPA: helix-turn-helix transcriptional regulator [Burkholderiales bacterium]|nr:helix-turn-helix transcriptional regulator [Burkholderiales bacterium]